MVQVLASPSTASVSQLATGQRSATGASSRAAHTPLVVRSAGTGQWYGGNRFKQQQRAPRPQAYPRPQGFGCGPFDSFGVGVGSMNLGDVERIMQDVDKWVTAGDRWASRGPGGRGGRPGSSNERDGVPLRFRVDIEEDAETYTFLADLPGVSRADTKVQANKDERTLTISGSRAAPDLDGDKRRRRGERRFGKFQRSFTLPEDADLKKISATFRDGVLSVTVQRVKPVEPEVEDVPIDDWIDISLSKDDSKSSSDEDEKPPAEDRP